MCVKACTWLIRRMHSLICVSSFRVFSKQKNTPPVLQGKIKLILEKAYTDSAFDEEKILKQLPVSLQQEIERHDRKSLRESTAKIPLFSSAMTSGEEKLVNVLMKVMHPLVFQSGDGTCHYVSPVIRFTSA